VGSFIGGGNHGTTTTIKDTVSIDPIFH